MSEAARAAKWTRVIVKSDDESWLTLYGVAKSKAIFCPKELQDVQYPRLTWNVHGDNHGRPRVDHPIFHWLCPLVMLCPELWVQTQSAASSKAAEPTVDGKEHKWKPARGNVRLYVYKYQPPQASTSKPAAQTAPRAQASHKGAGKQQPGQQLAGQAATSSQGAAGPEAPPCPSGLALDCAWVMMRIILTSTDQAEQVRDYYQDDLSRPFGDENLMGTCLGNMAHFARAGVDSAVITHAAMQSALGIHDHLGRLLKTFGLHQQSSSIPHPLPLPDTPPHSVATASDTPSAATSPSPSGTVPQLATLTMVVMAQTLTLNTEALECVLAAQCLLARLTGDEDVPGALDDDTCALFDKLVQSSNKLIMGTKMTPRLGSDDVAAITSRFKDISLGDLCETSKVEDRVELLQLQAGVLERSVGKEQEHPGVYQLVSTLLSHAISQAAQGQALLNSVCCHTQAVTVGLEATDVLNNMDWLTTVQELSDQTQSLDSLNLVAAQSTMLKLVRHERATPLGSLMGHLMSLGLSALAPRGQGATSDTGTVAGQSSKDPSAGDT